MFRIMPDNKIKLTKGDTATIKISAVNHLGQQYTFKNTDVITFRVKQNANGSDVIHKVADLNHVIAFVPSDTQSLNAGAYVYDIQVQTISGNVYTIIPLNYFDLEEEIS